MATGEVTGTVSEDGSVSIKDAEGKEVKYVPETDLLAVKGGKEGAEKATQAAEAAREIAVKEASDRVAAEHQLVLQAEAKVTGLTEQIAKGGATVEELAKAKQELETAQKSSEELGTKHLELRRSTVIATYGVPKETVESKDLAALDVYEEALKAVIGDKNLGNFAIGGGGAGAAALQGKSPQELAVLAYSQNK